MTRKRTILCLALLASTAACSSGGGSSGGGGGSSAGAGNGGQATAPSTNFAQPSVYASSDGTANLSNATLAQDPTSQQVTITHDPTTNLDSIAVNIAALNWQHTFDLSTAQNPTLITNNGTSTFGQVNDGPDVLLFDQSLSQSNYGMWEHTDANGHQSVGAYATGTDTPSAQMPTTGTATYVGNAIGQGSNGQQVFNLVGTSNMTADFGKGSVTGNVAMNAEDNTGTVLGAWNPLAISANIAAGTNKFSGTVASTGTSTLTPNAVSGTTTGAFYGATGPSEIGGVLSVAGGTSKAIASFGGAKQ